MIPFKKILCPTDFSEPSYEAIKAAGELAYHFASELCVIHVVSPVPMAPMGAEPSGFNVSSYEQELVVSSEKSLKEIVNQLETRHLKVRLVVLRGNAADEIVRTAEEENADLIVIATRGRTRLDRLIFGSVAEKVVRLAKCPVLTVASRPSKEESEEARPEKGELTMSEEKSEKKKAYQEKIEAQLKEWGAKIDELKAKAGKSGVELKMKYERQIEDLRAKQDVVQKKLREFKESGEETWEGLKTGMEKSLGELKDSFDRTISRFKEMGEEAAEKVSKKKKAYVGKVDGQLKEWGIQINILKVKAGKSKAEAKIMYLKQIRELRRKQEAARKRLQKLKGSGDEAWEEVKSGLDKVLADLKDSFNRVASKFKEKK